VAAPHALGPRRRLCHGVAQSAAGAAEQDRVAEDARAATSQARFTGLLVVAMPSGGALFAELIQPGFLTEVLGSPGSAVLLVLAAALQFAGFVAIRHFSKVVD
jgi:Flp pilus assembly protein TadB